MLALFKTIQKYAYFLFTICIGIIIFATFFYKGSSIPSANNFDKLYHFLMFGGTTFFLLVKDKPRLEMAIVIKMLSMIFLGVLIEIIQPYVGRSASLLDVLADAIGVLFAIPMQYLFYSIFDRLE